MKILTDITGTCGNTPLVFLEQASRESGANIHAKLEFFNPLASVKDRIGRAMIDEGIGSGKIREDSIIVEPTSGNTGIALAFVCRVRNLKLILTMPETMSQERRQLLKHLGAELILTPGSKGMKGAIEEAKGIVAATPNAFMPDQFANPANPAVHKSTTGPEIWEATRGQVDIIVSGVGTGGTITGVSEYIKEKKKDLVSIAVEPADSPVLSGGSPGPHKIQGIGAGFIPKVLNKEIIDQIIQVKSDDAFAKARKLAGEYGILCGISSGANFQGALTAAEQFPGKNIVFFACDTGERYISTDLFAG